jgi:hypothetical protein
MNSYLPRIQMFDDSRFFLIVALSPSPLQALRHSGWQAPLPRQVLQPPTLMIASLAHFESGAASRPSERVPGSLLQLGYLVLTLFCASAGLWFSHQPFFFFGTNMQRRAAVPVPQHEPEVQTSS